ncbi:MAG TPA: menaquinone biosynthesis protein [Bryobacteraceae bacterium]|nr:menaquinone biosynthesis protein [Bryobacteraceae bacterium]
MDRSPQSSSKPRVCAVSYLNTVPLVWGLQHSGELGDAFDLRFALPSECADQLASGQADIGIVPVIEMARQGLDYFPGTGIACHGPVRSILLISKVPFKEIRTLATDSGSRTSAMLSQVILAEKFGVRPQVFSHPANLAEMLERADAALLIGDAALRVDPATLPFETLDLGEEWVAMTGLPMVFAVWAGRRDWMSRKEIIREAHGQVFLESLRYGLAHMEEIVAAEAPARQFSPDVVRRYLTHHIVFELGEKDYEGMRLYIKHALRLERDRDRVMITSK